MITSYSSHVIPVALLEVR